jgi:hypothetical protein
MNAEHIIRSQQTRFIVSSPNFSQKAYSIPALTGIDLPLRGGSSYIISASAS